MPFRPIAAEKRADAVVKQIELLILRGVLRPGERLPAERDLAERMDVSRPSLREAIAHLSQVGLLESRAGAGLFVADVMGNAFSPALISLFQRHDEALFDMLSFRRDLEGQAVARAAREATVDDIALVRAILDRMEAAHEAGNFAAEIALDAEFHLAILEASHNVVLLHMMRSMFDLVKQGVFYSRERVFAPDHARSSLLLQHRAIYEALLSRDPDRARREVEAHLDHVRNELESAIRAERNAATASLKLQRDQQRNG